VKRVTWFAVSLVLLAAAPVLAQEAEQPSDVNSEHSSSFQRVSNTSGFELLSRATPQELGNYPFRILAGVRNHWFPQLRELRKSGAWKQGAVAIEFEINRDGTLGDVKTLGSAGNPALDAAASQAITSAAPFSALPNTYRETMLRLRYYFGYDQPVNPVAPVCNGPNWGAHAAAYPVRRVGNGVSAPHATSAPDPEYSDLARRMKYQSRVRLAGTVDPGGSFTDLCILVPAGEGLDEKAIEAVKGWRFEPGAVSGSSAAVRINVEVDFRLY
jgi:TonB family protein